MSEIYQMTISELDKGLTRGDFSLQEMWQSCIDRVLERDDSVGAFQIIDFEKMQESIDLNSSKERGNELFGIPFGVKDIMDTYDLPTQYGSRIYEGFQPKSDAAIVASLRYKGAIVFGKTVTTEFAYFEPGKTRNPRNLNHTPGGSSQGSAAAVSDCMIPFALGSQTAASVIRPAAYCGVVGYKSTVGEFSLGGVCALSQSMDSLGFFVRHPNDLAIIRKVLRAQVQIQRPTRPNCIALVRTPHWESLCLESQTLLERVVDDIRGEGVRVDDVELGGAGSIDLVQAHKTVIAFESARSRAYEFHRHQKDLSDPFRELLVDGWQISESSYRKALDARNQVREKLRKELSHYDFFISPSAPGEAPEGLTSTGDPIFSRGWTLLGGPAITLPLGAGANHLPLGVQLSANLHQDDKLVAHASWLYENIRDD